MSFEQKNNPSLVSQAESIRAQAQTLRAARTIDTGRQAPPLGSNLGTLTDSVGNIVRDYPGPALLMGAGLAWLLVSREQRKGEPLPARLRHRAENFRGAALDAKDQLLDSAAGARASILDTAQGARDQLLDKASGARDQLLDKAHDARDQSSQSLHDAQSKLDDVKNQLGEKLDDAKEQAAQSLQNAKSSLYNQAEHARDAYQGLLDDSPMVIGACAVALGIAIGLLLPSTRQEDDLMGPTRDSLLDQAKAIVNDAREAAVTSLRSGSGSVKATIGEAAADVKNELKDTLQESFSGVKATIGDAVADVKSEVKGTLNESLSNAKQSVQSDLADTSVGSDILKGDANKNKSDSVKSSFKADSAKSESYAAKPSKSDRPM